jgi:hypothetical protein
MPFTSAAAGVLPPTISRRFRPSAAYRAAAALREWGPVRGNWVRMRRFIGD